MRGLIYKIHCLSTQRAYIGKTRRTCEERWNQHCLEATRNSDAELHVAIREHGIGAFEVTILQAWDDISDEALQSAEAEFIRDHDTFHNGYNMHLKGESPFTPVSVEDRTQMAERLQSEIKNLVSASISENTKRAYKRALAGLADFLSENESEFSDNALAAYISMLHTKGKSPSTIAIVVAASRWQLKNESKTQDLPITTRTLAGIRREGRDRGRGQVTGLDWQQTERVCAFAESENTIIGLRDSAMIRLMSDCLLRVSEVVAVNVSDFEKQTLVVRTSKTDQEGASTALYVTSETQDIIERYQKRASITSGALFRRIRRGDRIQSERLTDFSARRIIQKRASDAGVEGFIAGHSLRVGSAVALAQAGASVVEMQIAGRWKSPQMPAHYAKSELAERGAIAKYKEKQKSKGS